MTFRLRHRPMLGTALGARPPVVALLAGMALLVADAGMAGRASADTVCFVPELQQTPAADPTAPVELTPEQAQAAYDCLKPAMADAYGKSGDPATAYTGWPRFSRESYQSATHGQRYVQNYAQPGAVAEQYARFEEVGQIPAGGVLAKDSFVAHPDGRLEVGPLFIMEKLAPGAGPKTSDWSYRMVAPGGIVARDEGLQQFCADCHAQMAEAQDSLFLVPEELRIGGQ